MILPAALILGAHLIMPVADSVPTSTSSRSARASRSRAASRFTIPTSPRRRRTASTAKRPFATNLPRNGRASRRPTRSACTNESEMGGEFELHRVAHLPGNGARRADHEQRQANKPAANPLPATRSPPGHRRRSRRAGARAAYQLISDQDFADGWFDRAHRGIGRNCIPYPPTSRSTASADAFGSAVRLTPDLQPPGSDANAPPSQSLTVATPLLSKPLSLNGFLLSFSSLHEA